MRIRAQSEQSSPACSIPNHKALTGTERTALKGSATLQLWAASLLTWKLLPFLQTSILFSDLPLKRTKKKRWGQVLRVPGVRGAAGPFSPVVSTMLPSVWTTISVAFSVFRLSPICRAVLPD